MSHECGRPTYDQCQVFGFARISLILDGGEPFLDKVLRRVCRFLVDNNLDGTQVTIDSDATVTHQVHALGDETARHPNVDSCLLAIAGKDPDLDASLLERMNCVGHALLEFVFNGRRSKEQHILLDELGRRIKSVTAILKCGCRASIDLSPLHILLFSDLAAG
jgi:hypothetical protein